MKLSQWWKTGLAWGIVLSVGLPISTTEVAAQEETARIYCGQNYDEESDATSPATIVKINDQKTTLIIWTEEKFSNPQQRCEESSPRFQEAYDVEQHTSVLQLPTIALIYFLWYFFSYNTCFR